MTIVERCCECGHYGACIEVGPNAWVCEDCERELRNAGELPDDDEEMSDELTP